MEGPRAEGGSIGGNHYRASSRACRRAKMSVEGSSNRCKMDTRPDWTLMRDLHRGNGLCHISSSSPNVEINYES